MKLKQRIILNYFRLKFKLLEAVNINVAAKEAFKLLCTPYTRKRIYTVPPVFEQGIKVNFNFQHYKNTWINWKSLKPNNDKILICHGFDSASYRFAHFVQPLLDNGFEVLAFDAPAHGLSTGKLLNILLYRNFILEVINRFGPVDGLIGHSFGGIASALVAELPEAGLKRLVLIAPATETSRSISDFCKVLHISKRLQDQLEHLILSIGGEPVSWYSVARAIQSITIPTLWLHDEFDTITPYADLKHLKEIQLPHVSFKISQGLGHSLYNDKNVLKQVIDFFKIMVENEP